MKPRRIRRNPDASPGREGRGVGYGPDCGRSPLGRPALRGARPRKHRRALSGRSAGTTVGAIGAVFRSWDNDRAKEYRRLYRIPEDWGTAVNVQAMVFGNRGKSSATGVAFTRDPATGEKRFYGEFLPNAQGEDVVAGIRTPHPLASDGSGKSLEETMPEVRRAAVRARPRGEELSRHAGPRVHHRGKTALSPPDAQRQANRLRRGADRDRDGRRGLDRRERSGPPGRARAARPASRSALPARREGAAVKAGRLLAKGLPAGPGAACGRIAFTAKRAVDSGREGDPVVLVRSRRPRRTSPA